VGVSRYTGDGDDVLSSCPVLLRFSLGQGLVCECADDELVRFPLTL
jgi:hypothetical protein